MTANVKLLFPFFLSLTMLSRSTIAIAETCNRKCLLAKKAKLEAELEAVNKQIKDLNPNPAVSPSSDFWVTMDLGLGTATGIYPTVGLSVPFLFEGSALSAGIWGGSEYSSFYLEKGFYISLGWSKVLFD